ncbi:hypothetical protein [Thermogemmatispora sp.]|uniref:hypothetical protein n=1 Tax=Thermogemmatispora sp. TaxID=1968838 RepID=UPI001DC5BBEE|nr:hypothetical protein [Thermogemmatispora sp.]MBX5450898.1 hypothetical protein [Thermogemmatispora sp.]
MRKERREKARPVVSPRPGRWRHQLVALLRLEWWLLRAGWQEVPWWRRILPLLGLLPLLGPSLFLLAATLLVPALVARWLPAAITVAFGLLLVFQALRAPGLLWEGDELIWYLLVPLPRSLLLLRPLYRLLRELLLATIMLLLLPSVVVWLAHGAGSLIGQLWLASVYLLLLCSLLAPTGLLCLTWCLGIRRARSTVASAAVLLCLPALLIVGLPLGAVLWEGESWLARLSAGILMPATLLLRAEEGLLSGHLTGADGMVLLGALLLLIALGAGYGWLGGHLYQNIWEGLQEQREKRDRRTAAPIKKHPLWELAWHMPGLPPPWAALLGYCWREGLWSWADLPTIVVDLAISVGIMAGVLLSPEGIQLYRDLWPLVGVPSLLMASQPMLLVLSRGLARRLLQPRWLLRSVPVRAGGLFGALWLAVLLPSLLIWLGLALIAGWLLRASLPAIGLCLLMLGLGLAANVALSLMVAVFGLADGERLLFPILLPMAIPVMLLSLCVTLITALLFIPTLPKPLRQEAGLSMLSPGTGMLLGTLAVCLIASMTALASWLGSKRLNHLLRREFI